MPHMLTHYFNMATVAVGLALGAAAAPATGADQPPVQPEQTAQALTPQELVLQGISQLLGAGVEKDAAKAVASLHCAAEQGYAPAQYMLAMLYYIGKDVPADAAAQYRWSRAAAEQGYAPAQDALGICYAKGLGVEKNPAEALKWYRLAAEQGYPRAQENVALAYRRGLGVEKNMEEALRWYRRAAEQGDSYAQNSLGNILFNGKETKKNLQEAAKWFRLAAEQGHGGACYNYGLCLEHGKGTQRNHPQAAYWYKAGADKDNKNAHCRLGIFLTYGTTGVDKNIQLGLRHLRTAATLGSASAFNSLAASYEKGRGVTESLPHAFERYKISAEMGDGEGMYNLARCYRFGKGVKRDYAKAMEWYLKAYEETHREAAGCIGYMYLKGMGVQKNYDEACKWLRRGVERGHNSAFRHLGRLYANGWGAPKNEDRAAFLHRKLAEGFNYDGLYETGRNYFLGIGVEKDIQKAIAYWRDSMYMNDGDAACCLGLLRLFGQDGRPADEKAGLDLIENGQTSVTARYNIGMCYESGFGRPQDLRQAVRYYLRATRSENPCPQAIAALHRLGVQAAAERDSEGYAFTITHPETALSADEVKAKFIWPCNIYLTDGGMVDDWITMQPIEEQATPAPEPAPEANAADVARAKLELATLAALMGNTPTALQIYQSAEKQGSTLSLDCQAILILIDNTHPDSATRAEALLRRAELRQDFYAPALLTALQDLPTRSGSDAAK